jgi:hypothetical protein
MDFTDDGQDPLAGARGHTRSTGTYSLVLAATYEPSKTDIRRATDTTAENAAHF